MTLDFATAANMLFGVDMSIENDLSRYLDKQATLERRDERLRKLYSLEDILQENLNFYVTRAIDDRDQDQLIGQLISGKEKLELGASIIDDVMHQARRYQDKLVDNHED
jgi:hypothetical protein